MHNKTIHDHNIVSSHLHYYTHRKKSFSSLCNQEIVDLEPVTGPDVELVRGLVQEHQQLTGSTVSERLLGDWDRSVNMFVKVCTLKQGYMLVGVFPLNLLCFFLLYYAICLGDF